MVKLKSYNSSNDFLDDDSRPKIIAVTEDRYEYLETFEALDLPAPILRALHDDFKLDAPNRMQAKTLPLIATKPYNHLVAQARLGSGKLLCYAVAMLKCIDLTLGYKPQALVICPTVELANEVKNVVMAVGRYYDDVSVELLIPGGGYEDMFHVNAHVVIGLPSTIRNSILRKKMDVTDISMVILDEMDDMVEHASMEVDDKPEEDDMEEVEQVTMARDIVKILTLIRDIMLKHIRDRRDALIKTVVDIRTRLNRRIKGIMRDEDDENTELLIPEKESKESHEDGENNKLEYNTIDKAHRSEAVDQTSESEKSRNIIAKKPNEGSEDYPYQVLVFYASLTDKVRQFIPQILEPAKANMNWLFVNEEEKSVFCTRLYKFSPDDSDTEETKFNAVECLLESLESTNPKIMGSQVIIYVNPSRDITMLRERLDNAGFDVVITVAQPMLLKRKTDDEKLLKFKLRKASVLIISDHVFTPGCFDQSKIHSVIFYDLPMVLNVPDYVLYYKLATLASKGLEEGCVFHASRQHEGLLLHIEKHFGRTSKQLMSFAESGDLQFDGDAMNMEGKINFECSFKAKHAVYMDFGLRLGPFKDD